MKSMMGQRIWKLMQADPEGFKQETRAYFASAYPGWSVVRVKYPLVFLRDDRGLD
ncbi:hypothetical protein J2T13_004926 [Paenibacillus sp. DS2015]